METINEAIVLVGGRGTRLQEVVSDLPKPMAAIGEKPFLAYLLLKLKQQNIQHVILSVGYMAEKISTHFGDSYEGIKLSYAIEKQALGTGGAIKYALQYVQNEAVFVLNGDTFFDIEFQKLRYAFEKLKPVVALGLREVENASRYGTIHTQSDLTINLFEEKTETNKSAFINSGIYLIQKEKFVLNTQKLGDVFSVETDFFQKQYTFQKFIGVPYANQYFIDIGIPEDYFKACIEIPEIFKIKNNTFKNTLFLDRDGVINEKIENSYVLDWQDFKFKPGFFEFLKKANSVFEKVIVVTNQRCVERGLITFEKLEGIHQEMINLAKDNGGSIEAVYYCPDISEASPCRKPNTGMFEMAKSDFKSISFDKNSYMVGDSLSDMIPANKLKLNSVFILNGSDLNFEIARVSDFVFDSTSEVASIL
jgi:D-glycero-alpha-D-manno-heptose 1-phosphate guanylyltransferase